MPTPIKQRGYSRRRRTRPHRETLERLRNATGGNNNNNSTASRRQWEVRKVLDHKVENDKIYYLLDWTPEGKYISSWEPSENCKCQRLIQEYWENIALNTVPVNLDFIDEIITEDLINLKI